MIDNDRVEVWLALLADKYSAVEIVELLELTEWDVIEAFRDKILESQKGVFEL